MNSSPDTGEQVAVKKEVRPWLPIDLVTVQEDWNPPDVAELQAIFRLPEGVEPECGKTALIKGGSGCVRPWTPQAVGSLVSAPAFLPDEPVESIPVTTHPVIDPRSAAQEEAARLIEDARRQAAELLEQARQERDQMLRQGFAEGRTAAGQQMSATLATAAQVVEQVNAWWQEMMQQSEPMVIGLVEEIAGYTFGSGMAVDQEVLQRNFQLALQKSRSLGDLKIFVHPEDAALLSSAWRELQVSLLGCEVRIIPAEEILRGGCYIEGQLGAVDARVQTRLAAVQEMLDAQKYAGAEEVQ